MLCLWAQMGPPQHRQPTLREMRYTAPRTRGPRRVRDLPLAEGETGEGKALLEFDGITDAFRQQEHARETNAAGQIHIMSAKANQAAVSAELAVLRKVKVNGKHSAKGNAELDNATDRGK